MVASQHDGCRCGIRWVHQGANIQPAGFPPPPASWLPLQQRTPRNTTQPAAQRLILIERVCYLTFDRLLRAMARTRSNSYIRLPIPHTLAFASACSCPLGPFGTNHLALSYERSFLIAELSFVRQGIMPTHPHSSSQSDPSISLLARAVSTAVPSLISRFAGAAPTPQILSNKVRHFDFSELSSFILHAYIPRSSKSPSSTSCPHASRVSPCLKSHVALLLDPSTLGQMIHAGYVGLALLMFYKIHRHSLLPFH